MAKFKVIWSTYQIIASVAWTLDISWGEPFATLVRMIEFTQLNMFSLMPIGCVMNWSHYTNLLGATLGPLLVAALIVIVGAARVFLAKPPALQQLQREMAGVRARRFGGDSSLEDDEKPDQAACIAWWVETRKEILRSHHINLLLLLSFIVLPTSSVTVLRTFHCKEFDDGDSYLVADYVRECYNAKHHTYVIYAALMCLVYPLGAFWCVGVSSSMLTISRARRDTGGLPVLACEKPRSHQSGCRLDAGQACGAEP